VSLGVAGNLAACVTRGVGRRSPFPVEVDMALLRQDIAWASWRGRPFHPLDMVVSDVNQLALLQRLLGLLDR